jgi:hypothetical protein
MRIKLILSERSRKYVIAQKLEYRIGVVVLVGNPSTWEAEAGES